MSAYEKPVKHNKPIYSGAPLQKGQLVAFRGTEFIGYGRIIETYPKIEACEVEFRYGTRVVWNSGLAAISFSGDVLRDLIRTRTEAIK